MCEELFMPFRRCLGSLTIDKNEILVFGGARKLARRETTAKIKIESDRMLLTNLTATIPN